MRLFTVLRCYSVHWGFRVIGQQWLTVLREPCHSTDNPLTQGGRNEHSVHPSPMPDCHSRSRLSDAHSEFHLNSCDSFQPPTFTPILRFPQNPRIPRWIFICGYFSRRCIRSVVTFFIMEQDATTRFMSKVAKIADGCWSWQGYCRANGYGEFWYRGRARRAYRVSVMLFKKTEIPHGMTVDHLCRNPRCVNPNHLEIVTQRVNVLRGHGIAAKNALKTHCPQGHQYSVDNTYIRGRRRYCKTCKRAHLVTWRENLS